MNNLLSSCSTRDPDWNQLWPILDEVMHELAEEDREIVLLRFFEKVPLASVGERLGLSANTTAKRVERVLEKLRTLLIKRGITSTGEALALLLADQAIAAAPVDLGTTITVAALTSASKSGGAAAGLLQILGTQTTLGTMAVLGLAGFLVIGSVGTAVYELQANRHAQAELLDVQQAYQAEQARVKKLVNSANEAEERVAEIQRNLDRMPASAVHANVAEATAAASTAKRGKAKIDGKNFLATFGQARSMLMAVQKAQLSRGYAAFYRSAGLTPEQIGQFEDQTTAFMVDNTVVTPTGLSSSVRQLPDDQLNQILGDQLLQQFQDYQRMLFAEDFAQRTTITVGYTAEPFSADQEAKLAQIVANNSSYFQSGGNADSSSVDWNAVADQARSLFSPAQWQAAESIFLRQQFSQGVAQAQISTHPATNP